MNNPSFFKFYGLVLFTWTLVALTVKADESCEHCSQPVDVSGQFSHHKIRDDQKIDDANGDSSAFHEELAGKNFTVTVPHLPAGRYTVIIGEVETEFETAGQRRFDIHIGDQVVADRFDIFAAAGGAGKTVYLTNEVEHLDGSVRGPLTITFTGRSGNAKLNTFEIRDGAGTSLVATRAADLAEPFLSTATKIPVIEGPEIWKDPAQPVDARVENLLRRMSLAEKVSQIRNDTPAIPRLGISAYNFWNEALHGVGRAGIATVFPQAIGMAATWDVSLVHQEGDVISTEGRAKHNEYVAAHQGDSAGYFGLTFWSPNINIFRDPRWGRGQETYGEDTFLTGTIGTAFIRGLQGDDPHYLKAMACAKHFAVHSGPESTRHHFDSVPPERDLYETYLPHFEMAVREGRVGGFMGAYNSLYGVPACANPVLLSDILRKQWGFDGYIVSDCGAINDINTGHKYVATPEAAAAAAIKAGCDICCGGDYNALLKAVQKGLVTEKEIDVAVAFALKARFRLGLFDPSDKVPFSRISMAENDTPEHQALALQAARESIVLLKNDRLLPLNRKKIARLAVIGMNANSVPLLLGNYNGTPSHPVTILDGIKKAAGADIEVIYEPGCPLVLTKKDTESVLAEKKSRALAAAKLADVVIYVGGINSRLEGEEGDAITGEGFFSGDRTRIELPVVQENLIKELQAASKALVFVNCSGSAIAMPWETKHLPAIVQAWYPGEQGGEAVGEVLFGDVNPSGRLPVTFYQSTSDLPPFEDYSMSNRTYRYFNGQPLFAFGHGLSYTTFKYQDARFNQANFTTNDTMKLTFTIKNTGKFEGAEVAQVYFRHVHSSVSQPREALCGFIRVHLSPGKSVPVAIEIPTQRLRYWDTVTKRYVIEPGNYEFLVGAASDDIRLRVPAKINGI